MKNIIISFIIAFVFTGCINTNIGFRSVMTTTSQEATTEGMIMNKPNRGNSSVEAPKETKIRDAVKPEFNMKSLNPSSKDFIPEVGVKYIVIEPKESECVPEPVVEP